MTPEDRAEIKAIVTDAVADASAATERRFTDLTELIVQTEQRAAERERHLQTELTALIVETEQRSAESARDLQTEILRGLESFARGNLARFNSTEARQTSTEARQNHTDARIAALEERVLYLETRRPPQ